MNTQPRRAAFVLAATDQGSLIVNRFDHYRVADGATIGVGFHLLESCRFDPDEIEIGATLLGFARHFRGDGVVALDCGANIGVHTVNWARTMTGWGEVWAFEAQERLFYALAGNIALNNCFNARARHAAVAATPGVLRAFMPDYTRSASFGSLELRQHPGSEFIGQVLDAASMTDIPRLSIDALALPRVDLIKIDVEGMELEVLAGALGVVSRDRPLIIAESLKVDAVALRAWLDTAGYVVLGMGNNFVCVHALDPMRPHVEQAWARPPAPPVPADAERCAMALAVG